MMITDITATRATTTTSTAISISAFLLSSVNRNFHDEEVLVKVEKYLPLELDDELCAAARKSEKLNL